MLRPLSLAHQIKPVNDRILCKVAKKQERKMGDIVLPELSNAAANRIGEVVSLSDSVKESIKKSIKVGSKVLMSEFGGEKFNINECEYRMMKADDILGVIQ